MKPTHTRIQGIGPHADTTIEWSKLASPIAITASRGSGKTWAIEAIPLALFGEGGYYCGSIYDALTQGGTGKGKIELEFEHGGECYRVERTIRDTGNGRTQKASLYQWAGETRKMLAGPKVSDFDRAIQALLGVDAATFYATTFLSQARTDDLCGLPGDKDLLSRRRDVLNSLLGGEHLDALADRFATRHRAHVGVVEELEAQLAGEDDVAGDSAGAAAALKKADEDLTIARANVSLRELALEAARGHLRDTEGRGETLLAQVQRHEQAVAARCRAEKELEDLVNEIKDLRKRAAGLQQAEADVDALAAARERKVGLEAARQKFEAWERWDRERERLAGVLETASATVAALRKVPGADDETKALAEQLVALREEYREAEIENTHRGATIMDFARTRAGIELQIAGYNCVLDDFRQRLAQKPGTLFGDKCAPCPLLAEYAGLAEKIAKGEQQLRDATVDLANVPDSPVLIDLAGLIERGAQARAAADAVEKAELTTKDLEIALEKERAARRAIQEHVETKPPEVRDPAGALAEAHETVACLAGAPERVAACKQAAEDVEPKNYRARHLEEQIDTFHEEAATLKAPADLARKALDNRVAQRAELERDAGRLAAELAEAQGTVESFVAQIAGLEEREKELARRRAAHAAKRDRAAAIRDEIGGLADLRTCFGPRGVRQILIDDAAAAIEETADGLFESATGGRQRLRISTQRVLQDGSIAEDFGIMVKDQRGERDVLRFSGGEAQLIRILFRIAIAIWNGQIRGEHPDSLFLDEAFDQLGAEGAEELLAALEYLGDRFSLICVVTHDPLIAARLPSQVRMKNTLSGVGIEVSWELLRGENSAARDMTALSE